MEEERYWDLHRENVEGAEAMIVDSGEVVEQVVNWCSSWQERGRKDAKGEQGGAIRRCQEKRWARD